VKPTTVVVSVPVAGLERTLRFYRDGLGLDTPGVDERMIVIELPNLSLCAAWAARPWNHLDGLPARHFPLASGEPL
jgi:catechol 2,3-dioxygenase-like lactoylglutathione lyase family enzyme